MNRVATSDAPAKVRSFTVEEVLIVQPQRQSKTTSRPMDSRILIRNENSVAISLAEALPTRVRSVRYYDCREGHQPNELQRKLWTTS